MTRIMTVAACAGAACLALACSPRVDFERMRQQRRADPYAASPLFSNGMTMRTPPAGTMPVVRTDAAVPALTDEHHFEVFCAVCHGADGAGRSIVASNLSQNPLPSLLAAEAIGRSDAEMLDIISHGRKRMPAFDWALSSAERTAVVAYVRQLQRAGDLPAGDRSR